MTIIDFDSENLVVDWVSFNIQGLTGETSLRRVAGHLSRYFTPSIQMSNGSKMGYVGLRKKYRVSLRECTEKTWVGSQIIFSGESAAYFYKLVKSQKFDWEILKVDQCTLSLGRIDLCFSRPNDWSHTSKLFDTFLVDSRSHIQDNTNTKYIKLEDFPDGKMLKVNRRNNSLHYRVYQKGERVRFELELKHRQTKLVQDYLFQNQLDIFEDRLVRQYFKFSGKVLRLDYVYTDWIVDFQRRYEGNLNYRSLVTSYLESQIIKQQEEEKSFFHLLQFLSFVKSLKLNPFKDCRKYRLKEQCYYELKFSLSQFVKFTGMHLSNRSEREKLIFYFYQLQKLDPIVKVFSDMSFRSYVCFPYVKCNNSSGKSWVVEVLVAEELFSFPYPFQLPKSFLISNHKHDLRLKVRLMKSLAVREREKRLNLEEFFNPINVRNADLIQIKKTILQLLRELVENKIIHNQLEIVLKSGKKKEVRLKKLTTSDITRRIKYLNFTENIRNIHIF